MQNSTPTGKLLSIGESSEYLGVSIDTLRRWEKKGRIAPLRSPGGHRYYSRDDLDTLFGKRYTRDEETVRRTNEELEKTDTVQKQSYSNPPNPLSEPEALPSRRPDKTPSEIEGLSGNIPIDSTLQDAVKETSQPIVQIPENPVSFAVPENIASVTPQTIRYSGEIQKPFSIPEIPSEPDLGTIREDVRTTHENVGVVREDVGATRVPPGSNIIPSKSAIGATRESPELPNILLPAKEENNSLSDEEIERRIHTIITKEKEKTNSNIFLAIGAFIMLTVDVVLLYLWFSSSRISSPIP